jgi:succinate dehydrogenase flavin-adding protein (antitoxin of CptAB toxin-antitoxin module)
MKKISLLLLTLLVIACGNKQKDLTVMLTIKGLQKGTVYLKKMQDTVLVTVDSVNVNGNSNITLYSDIDTPEMFFLYLDKNSLEKDRISFFADKGITEINTTLKNFTFDAKIKGSKQQKVLEEYQKFLSRTNNRNLDLIKEAFDAKKINDTAKLKAIEKEQNNAIKRKYLYTVNFALNNKDSEVAPYLALTEIYNARIDLLDTINTSITPEVKASKYGLELEKFIKKIKETE